MAQQTINVGTSPNDGTGTPLRTAFQYTNSNFSELYTAVGPSGNNIVVPGSATITGDLTVDTNVLKVDTTLNRVGIGTASPIAGSSLDVRGAVGTGTDIQSLTLIDTSALAINNGGGLSFGYVFESPSTVIGRAGYIKTIKENATDGNYASAMVFGVTANGAATAERYRIASDGVATWSNVGGVAGTAMTLNSTGLGVGVSPSFKLDVNGDIGVSGNENYVYLFSTYSIGNNSRVRFRAVGAGGGSGYGGDFRISTRASNNSWNTDAMTLDASGNLLVGTTSPHLTGRSAFQNNQTGQVTLRNSSATAGRSFYIGMDSGSSMQIANELAVGVYMVYGGTSWIALSDERLKDIIEPISNAVAKVGSLRSVIGKFKTDAEGTRRSFLIAQDVQAVLPEAVDASNPDKIGLSYSEVIPLLVAAIKELTARVQTLEAK